jgi:serine/threonine protein kinase
MPRVQATIPPGTILQGHYVIEGVLANGNSDPVYLVRDQRLQRHLFALKELMSSGERDGDRLTFETAVFKKRFVHPALPQVYDLIHDDSSGRLYVLLEYVDGSSLEEARHLQPEQRFSLSQAMTIVSPIMEAVIYLHSQRPLLLMGTSSPLISSLSQQVLPLYWSILTSQRKKMPSTLLPLILMLYLVMKHLNNSEE